MFLRSEKELNDESKLRASLTVEGNQLRETRKVLLKKLSDDFTI